jgi:hypothetical protein
MTPGDLIRPACRAHGSIRIMPLIMSPMTTLAPTTTRKALSMNRAPIIVSSVRIDRTKK